MLRRFYGRLFLLRLGAAAMSAVALGCHQEILVTGTVTIPVSVQALFSKERPGNVEVWPSDAGGAVAVRYLCEPTSDPIVLEYQIRDENCATEQLVEAAAFRVRSDRLPRVRCGERDGSSGGVKGEELAYASAPIFQGRRGCDSGEAAADLVLVPK